MDMAVNPDHIYLFFQYPPKYSLSFIAKKIKGRSSRILRKEFPHLREWCGDHLWSPGCYHGSVGQGWEVVEKYIYPLRTVRKLYRQKRYQAPYPSTGCPTIQNSYRGIFTFQEKNNFFKLSRFYISSLIEFFLYYLPSKSN